MTDAQLAEAAVTVNQIENAARDDPDACERGALQVVVRQAVALRRALEQQIVARAIQANQRKAE